MTELNENVVQDYEHNLTYMKSILKVEEAAGWLRSRFRRKRVIVSGDNVRYARVGHPTQLGRWPWLPSHTIGETGSRLSSNQSCPPHWRARSCGLPSRKQLFSTLQQTRKTPHARTCAVQVIQTHMLSFLPTALYRIPWMEDLESMKVMGKL